MEILAFALNLLTFWKVGSRNLSNICAQRRHMRLIHPPVSRVDSFEAIVMDLNEPGEIWLV